MHDLEQLIARWRVDAALEPGYNQEILDELETHLRGHIAALSQKGITTEEAFRQAISQLGDSRSLAGEFAKVDGSGWVPVWIISGLAAVWGCYSIYILWRVAAPESAGDWVWMAFASFGRIAVGLQISAVALALCYIVRLLLGDLAPGKKLMLESVLRIFCVFSAVSSIFFAIFHDWMFHLAPPTIHALAGRMAVAVLQSHTPQWILMAAGITPAVFQFMPRIGLKAKAASIFLLATMMEIQAMVPLVSFDYQMNLISPNSICLALTVLILAFVALVLAPASCLKHGLRKMAAKTLQLTK